jgi:hypothetical protein
MLLQIRNVVDESRIPPHLSNTLRLSVAASSTTA